MYQDVFCVGLSLLVEMQWVRNTWRQSSGCKVSSVDISPFEANVVAGLALVGIVMVARCTSATSGNFYKQGLLLRSWRVQGMPGATQRGHVYREGTCTQAWGSAVLGIEGGAPGISRFTLYW